MGGRWPAHLEDFEEAEVVCRELRLGELLSRMPAGLLQLVGETEGIRNSVFEAYLEKEEICRRTEGMRKKGCKAG